MQRSMTQSLVRNSFWLSVILHLLLLLTIIIAFLWNPAPQEETQKKAPNLFIPSFVYNGAIKPAMQSQSVRGAQTPVNRTVQKTVKPTQVAENTKQQEEARPEEKMVSKQGILRAKASPPPEPVTRPSQPQSILASSMAVLKANQMQDIRNNLSDTEPVLMIGDPNTPANPLIKLMARSLSTFFRYPDAEGMMGIKGRVLVKLTLHPEGYFTDVQLIQSSDNDNLDSAALYAVNKAPRVIGADHFIQKPKRYLIGFVFY